jgi:hypothetical protein
MPDLINLSASNLSSTEPREIDPLPLSSDSLQIKADPPDVLTMRMDQHRDLINFHRDQLVQLANDHHEAMGELRATVNGLIRIINTVVGGSMRTHPELAQFIDDTAHMRTPVRDIVSNIGEHRTYHTPGGVA